MRGTRLTRRGWAAVTAAGLILAAVAGTAAVRTLAPKDDAAVPSTPPSAPPTSSPSPAGPSWRAATPAAPPRAEVTVIAASAPTPASIQAVQRLVAEAPVLVVTPSGRGPAQDVGIKLARSLRAPVAVGLLPEDLLSQLGTETLVAVGTVPIPPGLDHVRRIPVGPAATRRVDTDPVEDLLAQVAAAPEPTARPSPHLLVMVHPDDPIRRAVAATAAAVGYGVIHIATPDPRSDAHAGAALQAAGVRPDDPIPPLIVAGVDTPLAGVAPDDLAWQLAVAARGLELPGGGQVLFPDRRLVALYGAPGSGALGVLGEQPLDAAIDRARDVADDYDDVSDVPVVPAFDMIVAVASAEAGADGDYSRPVDRSTIEQWVARAGEAELYVVLDIQPGRTDFLTHAKRFEDLLTQPHVGLALDPEWRLTATQRHLQQIGSVDGHEVQQVVEWLADLVREHRLPQKLLVVHQFQLRMIQNREVIAPTPELAVMIHMDGQGGQASKDGTYRNLTTSAPPQGVWWGWKNFYDEDQPAVRSPEETLAVEPPPWFVSYQ